MDGPEGDNTIDAREKGTCSLYPSRWFGELLLHPALPRARFGPQMSQLGTRRQVIS